MSDNINAKQNTKEVGHSKIWQRDPLADAPDTSFIKDLSENRRSLLGLAIIATLFHIILWFGWPLHSIRAIGTTQISYYVNAFIDTIPTQYELIGYRQPIPPLINGLTLSASPWVTGVTLSVMAVTSALMVYLIIRSWGQPVAILAALLHLFDLPVQLMYHQINTESFANWFFIAALLSVRYAIQQPTLKRWIWLGIVIGLGALSRPAQLGFVAFVAFLLVRDISWGQRLKAAAAAVVSTALVISPWIIYKGIRYDMWSFSRTGGVVVFYEAYQAQLVRPGNGPATQKLIDLINEHLLPTAEYRKTNTGLDEVLRNDAKSADQSDPYAPNRFFQDLRYIVNEYEGWDSDYKLFEQVGKEALYKYPLEYAKSTMNGLAIVALARDQIQMVGPRVFDIVIPGEPDAPPIYRSTWAHPPDKPLAPTKVWEKDRQTILLILNSLQNMHGNILIATPINNGWSAVWPPMIIFYVMTLAAFAFNKGVSALFLGASNMLAIALMAYSSLVGDLDRYRLPLEVVFLITAAISVVAIAQLLFGYARDMTRR